MKYLLIPENNSVKVDDILPELTKNQLFFFLYWFTRDCMWDDKTYRILDKLSFVLFCLFHKDVCNDYVELTKIYKTANCDISHKSLKKLIWLVCQTTPIILYNFNIHEYKHCLVKCRFWMDGGNKIIPINFVQFLKERYNLQEIIGMFIDYIDYYKRQPWLFKFSRNFAYIFHKLGFI